MPLFNLRCSYCPDHILKDQWLKDGELPTHTESETKCYKMDCDGRMFRTYEVFGIRYKGVEYRGDNWQEDRIEFKSKSVGKFKVGEDGIGTVVDDEGQ